MTSNMAGGALTSHLIIPADVVPGLYDLTTGTKWGNFTTSSCGSLVRVVARGHVTD